MNKDEAMQQALVALQEFGYHGSSPRWERAVNDLRTALLQPPLPVQTVQPEQTFYQPAANEAVEILKSLSYVYEPTYKSCARCLHKPTWPNTSGVCGGCRFYSNFRATPPQQPEQESKP